MLRLFRISFCLAALAAIAALAVSVPLQSTLTSAALVLGAAACLLWRFVPAEPATAPSEPDSVAPLEIGETAIAEAGSFVARASREAATFEDALHAVARTLKSELGALDARVFAVDRAADATPLLTELFAAQPGFRALPRGLCAAEEALGHALRERQASSELPYAVAVPVTRRGDVLAVIELRDIAMQVSAGALLPLLAAARTALEAAVEPGTPAAAAGLRR